MRKSAAFVAAFVFYAIKKRAAGNQRPVVIVGLGPMFEALPNGHLLLCRETLSRNEGIETMSARFPWVSAVDDLP